MRIQTPLPLEVHSPRLLPTRSPSGVLSSGCEADAKIAASIWHHPPRHKAVQKLGQTQAMTGSGEES
ncbi:Hypothetical predicted protein [Pelobates cultripes]|uniref:Uncharacterized protein n=1 Tax=Pelobates cultripes TaxID=61616 RepID=A0AAD1SZS2_PELCU|nr:Hypothetical predicted protein [Pelobates cultripes]